MSSRIIFYSLSIVLLGALATWFLFGMPQTGIDDADIFFVYAHNFADGHGFVYNIGSERVEGFTSLLWTLICSGFAVFFQSLEKPLFLLNLVIGALAVGVSLKRTENKTTYLLMLAGAPAWFAWCQVTLMETGLWCLIITLLGLAIAERRNGAVLLLMPFLLLTRPESMLWGAWMILLVFFYAEKGARLKAALPVLGIYLLTLGALIGFRMGYFGWPVPNTYYAKVTPGLISNIWNGLSYPGGYMASCFMVLTVAIVYFSLPRNRKQAKPLSLKLAWFLLPGLGIPVLVGGDHFGSFRFYQPLWPLLCLIGANEIQRMMQGRMAVELQRFVLPVALIAGWLVFPMVGNMKHEFRIAKEGRENGATLEQMFADMEYGPTVATITAGGNKLGYAGYVCDLMGLNSTEMAHAPGEADKVKNHTGFNRELFYKWEPDILLCGDSEEFDSLVLNGLHKEPRFQVAYSKVTLHRNGAELNAWYRNDFLMEIPAGVEEM